MTDKPESGTENTGLTVGDAMGILVMTGFIFIAMGIIVNSFPLAQSSMLAVVFVLLGGSIIAVPFGCFYAYIVYTVVSGRFTNTLFEFGWRRYHVVEVQDRTEETSRCVVCNNADDRVATHRFGKEYLFAGFRVRRQHEGTVTECVFCHRADEIDAGLRWDKYELVSE